MKRVFIIVLDSFGIGALPDAANYGDQGSDTLAARALPAASFSCRRCSSWDCLTSRAYRSDSPAKALPELLEGWQSVRQARTPPPDTGS